MRFIYLLLFVAILLQSCQYEPTGTNYVDVDPNFKPAQLMLTIPENLDTIWINSATQYYFNYKINGEIEKLTGVHVYFDTITNVFNSDLSTGNFAVKEIKTDSIEYHTLDIVATSKSGTGSLADKLGAEGTIYHQHYVLAYINLSMYQKDSLKFEEIDGKLKISFKPYQLKDFSSYRIDKRITGTTDIQIVSINQDASVTSLIDESYIGEQAEYRVFVEKINGSLIKLTSATKEAEMPIVSVKQLNRDDIEISWTKPKYIANCKKYVIDISPVKQTETISDNNTLSCIKKIPVGSQLDFVFSIWSEDYSGIVSPVKYPIKFSVTTGEQSFGFSRINSGTDNYIYFNENIGGMGNDIINQFDLNVNQVVRSVRADSKSSQMFSVSPNGKYILFKDGDNIILTTPNDFTNGKKIAISTFSIEPSNSIYNSLTISDNGIGALNSSTQRLYVYDFINNKLIAEITGSFNVKISAQGNYLLTTVNNSANNISTLYLIESDKISIIKNDFKIGFSKFNPYIDNQLIFSNSNNSTLIFYNCNNDTEDKTYNLNSRFMRAFDFESGLFMLKSDGNKCQIIDYNNSFTEIDNFDCLVSSSIFMKRKICYAAGSKKWEVGK